MSSPLNQMTALGVAALGLASVCTLAGMHVIQDGETTAGIASVLSAAVAIWHKDNTDGDNNG